MALSTATVFEVRQAGSDTNGGGYVTGASGTDYSQQNAAQIAVADAVTNGTTTITSATAAFNSTHVGNIIYVAGGTGSVAAQWYQVASVTNATTIVVDRSTGLTAGTGVTLNLGGALATPGTLTNVFINAGSGARAYIKYSATAYSLTTTTPGPAGPCNPAAGIYPIEGYDVTRGDRTGNRPLYQWGVAPGSATHAYKAGAGGLFMNLAADGAAQTNACGFSISVAGGAMAMECVASNCSGTGGIGYTVNCGQVARCQAASCANGFQLSSSIAGYLVSECDASGCTNGYLTGGTCGAMAHCLARGCTTGFNLAASSGAFLDRCTADACTTGYLFASASNRLTSCIASNCSGVGGVGFNCSTNLASMFNCASYNNLTEVSGSPLVNRNMILNASFTGGSPYVNQAGADFRPNVTAGAGALLRGAGVDVYGQADNGDIGAVQHTDPAGGGGSNVTIAQSSGMYGDW